MGTRALAQPMPIQEWINTAEIDDKLLGKDAAVSQMILVRDEASRTLAENGRPAEVTAVSWHLSTSVRLPVYRLETADGTLRLTMRDNFHNWMVSVEARRPLPDVFFDLFNKTERINPVYCEGFEPSWVFGPFVENRARFTVELHGRYRLMTFLYLLSVAAGLR